MKVSEAAPNLALSSQRERKSDRALLSWAFRGAMTVFQINKIGHVLKSDFLDKELSGVDAWVLDFKTVDQVDTAGIAYILSCIRASELYQCPLSFLNFPKEAENLAQAQGIFDLLKNCLCDC
jgi:ABC-type transporter Mla MlaB component